MKVIYFNLDSFKFIIDIPSSSKHNRFYSWSKANKLEERSKSTLKKNNGAYFNFISKPTQAKSYHTKNNSSPNIFANKKNDKDNHREKNISFHMKKEELNYSKHDVSSNFPYNLYLPHVKTKQNLGEYELFKKQRTSFIINFFFIYLL